MTLDWNGTSEAQRHVNLSAAVKATAVAGLRDVMTERAGKTTDAQKLRDQAARIK